MGFNVNSENTQEMMFALVKFSNRVDKFKPSPTKCLSVTGSFAYRVFKDAMRYSTPVRDRNMRSSPRFSPPCDKGVHDCITFRVTLKSLKCHDQSTLGE